MQLVLQLLREQPVIPPWLMRATYLGDLVYVGEVQRGVGSGRKQLEVRSQQLQHLPGSVTVTSIQRQQRSLLQMHGGCPLWVPTWSAFRAWSRRPLALDLAFTSALRGRMQGGTTSSSCPVQSEAWL